jgi:hypothetical protein
MLPDTKKLNVEFEWGGVMETTNPICPECGKEVGADSEHTVGTLCPHCGARFDLELGEEDSGASKIFSTAIKLGLAGLVLVILVILFFVLTNADLVSNLK